jgi:hypothetical protein
VFVEGLDGVGQDLAGVAEGVARDAHAVATQEFPRNKERDHFEREVPWTY